MEDAPDATSNGKADSVPPAATPSAAPSSATPPSAAPPPAAPILSPNDEENFDSKSFLSERVILKLQEAFSLFDHDCDGKLTLHQSATVIRAVGLGLTEKEISEILAEAPCAKIDFGTFLTSMADHIKSVKDSRADTDRAAILDAFRIHDNQKRGKIRCRDLSRILMKVGETLNKHEIDELLDDLGYGEIRPDDEISYEAMVEKLLEDY